MHGRIMVNASAKPYISVKTVKNESPLDTLKLVFKLMDKIAEKA